MGKVEDDAMRARPGRGREIIRRGDRVLVAIARIEVADGAGGR
ncbi:MAG TPA: hypothetical protein VFE41_20490 [Acetobacteraceae bacterium]|jgi:hypothetical protein|nr:hypothetical protein [Acetobacteraceae bacterium]